MLRPNTKYQVSGVGWELIEVVAFDLELLDYTVTPGLLRPLHNPAKKYFL